MDISGARALITGGSEGIGHGIAEALLAKGAQVAIMARNEDKLDNAAGELGARAIPGDVSREADAERAVATSSSRLSAASTSWSTTPASATSPTGGAGRRAIRGACFATNVTGAMLMAREAARHFVAQNKRPSAQHLHPPAGSTAARARRAYSGSKFALRGMTECWRAELRPHNVRVTLVNPSEVQTPFFGKVGHEQELSPRSCGPGDRRSHRRRPGDRRPGVHSRVLGVCDQSILIWFLNSRLVRPLGDINIDFGFYYQL